VFSCGIGIQKGPCTWCELIIMGEFCNSTLSCDQCCSSTNASRQRHECVPTGCGPDAVQKQFIYDWMKEDLCQLVNEAKLQLNTKHHLSLPSVVPCTP
jgi:hypothetical protein